MIFVFDKQSNSHFPLITSGAYSLVAAFDPPHKHNIAQ